MEPKIIKGHLYKCKENVGKSYTKGRVYMCEQETNSHHSNLFFELPDNRMEHIESTIFKPHS